MKLQFINNISLDVISGGNIYNEAVIDGLRQKDIVIDYHSSAINQNYDISIVDSLCMNAIDYNNFSKNKSIVSLIHQLPSLQTKTLDFYKSYSRFIVTGEPSKEALVKQWHIDDDNISIVRPGVSETWKPKSSYKDRPQHIIIVSNLIAHKGFEMLVKLLNRLHHLDLKFDIIGNNALDKTYAENIVRSIKNTNANVSFHFNLNRNDLYEQLIKADLFLSLSKAESFGMAIFEALTLGLPCLTYRTGDYNYFETHPNYLSLDHYSEDSFAEIIEEWIKNPKTYQSFCKSTIHNKRHWNHVVDEFLTVLKSTLIC